VYVLTDWPGTDLAPALCPCPFLIVFRYLVALMRTLFRLMVVLVPEPHLRSGYPTGIFNDRSSI